MKSSDFKKILKPLIKQTIKEVLFEEGVLSGIIKEVATGLASASLVTETTKTPVKQNTLKREREEHEKNRQERIRRLNESTKMNSNVFEGTKEIPEPNDHGPLSGLSSTDSGVDIAAIENLANGKWKQLI